MTNNVQKSLYIIYINVHNNPTNNKLKYKKYSMVNGGSTDNNNVVVALGKLMNLNFLSCEMEPIRTCKMLSNIAWQTVIVY